MTHSLDAIVAAPEGTIWICSCGHRSRSREAHVDHVEIEPHPVVRGRP